MKNSTLNEPSRSTLCGFGGKFYFSESLWAIGSKVCWSNHISAKKLIDLCEAEVNFRSLAISADGINLDQLYRLTGIPPNVAAGGTTRAFPALSTAEAMQFAFERLRYCRRCMETGFHSILFQLPLFSSCPAHGDLLVDKCHSCGGSIPYEWPRIPTRAFRCPSCGVALWVPRVEPLVLDERDKIFRTQLSQANSQLEHAAMCHGSFATLKDDVSKSADSRDASAPRTVPELNQGFVRISEERWNGYISAADVDVGSTPPRVADIYAKVKSRIYVYITPTEVEERFFGKSEIPFGRHSRDTVIAALITWRVFWERPVSPSTLDWRISTRDELERVQMVFDESFGCQCSIGRLSDAERRFVYRVAFAAILEASFVFAASSITWHLGRAEGRSLLDTPFPVILAVRKPGLLSVLWRQGQDFREEFRGMFSPTSVRDAVACPVREAAAWTGSGNHM